MNDMPVAAGKSSFDLIDTEKTMAILAVKLNSTFIDLACGIGNYALSVANKVGENGVVYAVDLWQEGIDALSNEIKKYMLTNIKPILADITLQLPLEKNSVDASLMATIIHDLSESDQKSAIQEAFRLLKPGGILHIIEFKKIEKSPGPPLAIRLEESDIDRLVLPHGFIKIGSHDIGGFNYLVQYKKVTSGQGQPV